MTNDSSDSLNSIYNQISNIKGKAEQALRTAEEASSKANSESGFAFNAKQNAEEHAKAISQVRGTVEADFSWLTTTKKNAEEIAQAISKIKTASENDTQVIAETRTRVETLATATKTESDRATALAASIEKAYISTNAAQEKVSSDAAIIATTKSSSENLLSSIQTLQTQASDAASKSTNSTETITKLETESKRLYASLSEISEISKTTHSNVIEYQEKLETLIKEFGDLHSKIESLLPNATSAGLASAFRNQKSRFSKPQRNWLITFVIAIVLLLFFGVIGLPGLWTGNSLSSTQESWDIIFRHLISRLPIVAPLVWLAIYAGRHYTLALRVEEEYAFKEAVSTAFEGYKREMSSISSSGEGNLPPLVTLCENVLRALAQRPGRIYEGQHDDITPLAPFAKAVSDGATGIISAVKK